jgi:hypothetical protein
MSRISDEINVLTPLFMSHTSLSYDYQQLGECSMTSDFRASRDNDVLKLGS